MAKIPVIDLAPFLEDKGVIVGDAPTKEQLKVAAAIDKANIEFGFLGVKNFGLSQEDVERYFRDAKELFAVPLAIKESKMKQAGEADFGYIPPSKLEVKHAGIQANKEAFKIREKRDYSFCPQAFQKSSTELFSRLENIKRRYCHATALALDLDFDLVWGLHKTTEATSMRYNHYAPFSIPTTASPEEPIVRLGAHTDFGTQTFLLVSEGANGLEILPRGFDDWAEVQLPQDVYCVVNVGDMWETLTNGRWKAIRHRVMLRNKLHADTDRYSIACFLNPRSESRIAPLAKFIEQGTISAYKPYIAGERFNRILRKVLHSTYVMEEKEPE